MDEFAAIPYMFVIGGTAIGTFARSRCERVPGPREAGWAKAHAYAAPEARLYRPRVDTGYHWRASRVAQSPSLAVGARIPLFV